MIDATPLLRLRSRSRLARLARQEPAAAQERQLLALLRHAASTRFGIEHGFPAMAGVADYQSRVPLRRYEAFWTEYWQPRWPDIRGTTWPDAIPYFANSSGTTSGVTKRIPVSPQMVESNRQGALDLLSHHVANRPRSRVFGGANFMLGGSTDLSPEGPGVLSGDLSGIAAAEVPWWARSRFFPPRDLALIADWEEKMARLAPASLAVDVRTVGGTPSWLLLFFDRLFAMRPEAEGRLAGLWPGLELLVHGGVMFAPYRRRFEALLARSHAELRECYAASEGFIAVQDLGPDEGMRLQLDTGLFYEFVPVEELEADRPTRHWIGNAEPGVNYALVVTSCAGLWSYILGDTVRLLPGAVPRLTVTGRTAFALSAFGEHLIGEEIDRGIAAGAEAVGATVADYAVAVDMPETPGALGGHVYFVELDRPDADPRRFAAALDAMLGTLNADYRDHRAGGFGMAEPTIRLVPPGGFAEWMRRRGKLGGQNKVPRLLTAELRASLEATLQ